MATQSGTLKAGYQLYIDIQNGDSSTVFDYTATGASVRDNGKAWKSDRVIGPFPEDVSFTVTYTGSPSIYKVQPNGQREYTAETLPDPATLGAWATVVVDGTLNVQSRGEFVPVRADANSLAVIGDSFSAHSYQNTGTAEEFLSYGHVGNAMMLSGYRLNIVSGGMLAIGFSGVSAAFAGVKFDTQLTAAIATGSRHLLVMGGVNDAINDVSPDVTFAAYVALINRAVNAGMKVWVCTQSGVSSSHGSYTVARQGAQIRLNQLLRNWFRNTSPRNAVLIDTAKCIIDPSSATWSPKSTHTYDGLHPNNVGAYYIGKEIARVWNLLIPECGDLVSSNADNTTYSSLSTNLVSNSLMISNTAGVANGFTKYAAGGGTMAGASVVARADGIGNDQVLPITFAAANDGYVFSTGNKTALVDGDTVFAECEVTLSSPVNVRSVKLFLSLTGGTITKTSTCNQATVNDGAYLEGFTFIMRTPSIKYVAATFGSTPVATSEVRIAGAGAGSVTAKISKFALHKVSV